MKQPKIIVIILAIIFFGCEKKVAEVDLEQKVFDEMFIEIVDSTYIDKRLYTCVPEQAKSIYATNGKWIGFDKKDQKEKELKCEIKRRALEKDTLNLVLAIKNEGIINSKTNLEKYNNEKFIFKHVTELPKNMEYTNWESKYTKFAGAMSFTHIKFDGDQKAGVVDVSYLCGGKCGLGYSVYIKKVEQKWIISKIQQTWIS